MPITKYTASADTTIVNAYYPDSLTRAVYANLGAADSLEIFSIYISGSETQKARTLVQFPISAISSSRASGTLPSSGNVDFYLKLFNVQHPETLPKKYYVLIDPISSSWDEGFGLDLENYSDKGQSGSIGYGVNWKYRSTTNSPYTWTSDGGDVISGYSKTFYFDEGTEDLDVNVTDIVEAQISGVIPNNGFMIRLSGAYEDGTNDTTYYTKRFSARSSEYFYKVPVIEARWRSVVNDDRGNFFYSTPNLSAADNDQNIYFYNRVKGVLKDLPSSVVPLVNVYNESGSLLTGSILSNKVATGTYKAVINITGAEEQVLQDVWFSGSNAYYTGSIEASLREFSDSAVEPEYVFALTNLKSVYKSYEKPSIRVYGRQRDWSPNIYKIASSEINTLTFNNLYYKIIRIVDGATIIDYGIDPIAYTLCSYDKNGNYFDLDMAMFQPGYGYAVKLMLLNGDLKAEYKEIFRFKVE
jgi:hypothetical protein